MLTRVLLPLLPAASQPRDGGGRRWEEEEEEEEGKEREDGTVALGKQQCWIIPLGHPHPTHMLDYMYIHVRTRSHNCTCTNLPLSI